MWTWSSWISSAKEKSVNALKATKRDLAEFVSVLGSDTKAAVKGASDNINKILVSPEDEDEEAGYRKNDIPPIVEPAPTATPYDRCQAELLALQKSSETFLQDPARGCKKRIVFCRDWGHFLSELYTSLQVEKQSTKSGSLLLTSSPIKMTSPIFWLPVLT